MPINWTQEKLQAVAEMMANHYWPEIETNFNVKINTRFGRQRGRYWTRTKLLEISHNLIKYESTENLIGTLKHELCHWACYEINYKGGWKDGEEFFESELVRVGSHSTKTKSFIGELHIVKCVTCNHEYKARTKAVATRWTNKSSCGVCWKKRKHVSALKYAGSKIISRKDQDQVASEYEE